MSEFISSIPDHVLYAMGAIYLFLIFASIVVFGLTKKNPLKDYRELTLRMKTWWTIIFFFSVIIFGSVTKDFIISLVFIAFLSFLALKEYFSLIPIRRTDRKVILGAYLMIPLQFWAIYLNWYDLFIIIIPVYAFLFLPFLMILTGETKGYVSSVSTIHWGLMITVFTLGHIAYLLALDPSQNPAGHRAGNVIFIVALTQLNDVAQYCWGKAIGKRKITPKVSPNKTVEGFLGGVFTTTILSVICAPYLTPITFGASIWVGLLIGIGGFLGDISISALKRDLGVKDSGTILPGHGGILDRIDSLSYTAPLFFHFLEYFFYV